MKIKKIISGLVLMLMTFVSLSVTSADNSPIVFVDDVQVVFDVEPIIDEGRTLVPMRGIFEVLGAEVEWIGETSTVVAVKDDIEINITINSTQMYRNGEVVILDVPAKLNNGRTLVPLRAICEGLGVLVKWDSNNKRVDITSVADEYVKSHDKESVERTYAMNELSTDEKEYLVEFIKCYQYYFEQTVLPSKFLLSDMASESAEMIDAEMSKLSDMICDMWDKAIIEEILSIQASSDVTVYNIKKSDVDFLKDNGIDSRSMIDVRYEETLGGKKLALIIFKENEFLDSIDMNHSLIAIASSGINCRYFTFEPSTTLSTLYGQDRTLICEYIINKEDYADRIILGSTSGDSDLFFDRIDQALESN